MLRRFEKLQRRDEILQGTRAAIQHDVVDYHRSDRHHGRLDRDVSPGRLAETVSQRDDDVELRRGHDRVPRVALEPTPRVHVPHRLGPRQDPAAVAVSAKVSLPSRHWRVREVRTPKIAEGKDVYEACLEAAQLPTPRFASPSCPSPGRRARTTSTRRGYAASAARAIGRYLKDVSFGLAPNVVFDVLDPVQANLPEWIDADALDNATTHEWGDSYKYVSVTAPDGARVHGVVVSKDPNGGGFWCPRLANLAKSYLSGLPVASLGVFSVPSQYERVIFLAQNKKCVHTAGMNSFWVRNGWNNATGDKYPYSILMGVQPNASHFQKRPSRPSRLSWQYESDHPVQYTHPLGNWGSTSTILHELIHALGVQRHAERYNCDIRNAAKLDSGSCNVASYGSEFSIMGRPRAALNMHSALYHIVCHREHHASAQLGGHCRPSPPARHPRLVRHPAPPSCSSPTTSAWVRCGSSFA